MNTADGLIHVINQMRTFVYNDLRFDGMLLFLAAISNQTLATPPVFFGAVDGMFRHINGDRFHVALLKGLFSG